MHTGGSAKACALQHGWPEQGMKIQNVLADKMMQLGGATRLPPGFKAPGLFAAQVQKAGHVTHRRIQPDIKILAGRIGNFKPEVGRITGDVPILQAGSEPFIEFVGHCILQGAGAGPLAQHGFEVAELEKQMFRFALHRCGAADHRDGIL